MASFFLTFSILSQRLPERVEQERNTYMKKLSIICLILILLCLSAVATRSETDRSLLLYFMFDEGEGGIAVDSSDYGNNGVIKGDPKWVEGRFGTALDLDGVGDTIEIPHNDGLNITTAITMEMWVRMANAGGDTNQAGIEKGGWEAGEYSLYPLYNAGTIAQFNDLPENCDDENIGPNIRNGEWRHLAGVWDGKAISLYVDGDMVRSAPCEGELLTNMKNVYIGSRNGGERFLIATVDEVRLYNRALTEEEIKTDMETSGLSVSPAEKTAICWGRMKKGYKLP